MMTSAYSKLWYQNASVRVKNYIVLNTDSKYPFFPEELQPLCQHPLIKESQPFIKEHILIHTCYKYLQEVCITENDIVNPTCLNIAFGNVPVQLTEEDKADAFSIIADEAFHSYVAKTLLLQIQYHTDIPPLLKSHRENEVTKAVEKIKKIIPTSVQDDFSLIATCIAESVFTDEIIKISRFKNVNESFHQAMVEHARDEGRHANYFGRIMRMYWEQADQEKKNIFMEVIPTFIKYCFDGIHDANFLEQLLQRHGFEAEQIKELVSSNNNEVTRANARARMNNIVSFFKRSNVLNPTLMKAMEELQQECIA